MPSTPLDILRNVYGYPSFRGLQEPVIQHICAGGDAVVLMPTGGGKSLCYQIPAMVRRGVGVIVSPLIALMRDQVTALAAMGARAECLNSSLPPNAAWAVERRLLQGELDLLYVAPERLMTPQFLSMLESLDIALFAIDEAHCVSQWGHDFRPEYLQLAVLKEKFPNAPRLALTATADGPTRVDIVQRLHFHEARIFSAGFDRPNIRYAVVPKKSAHKQLLDFIRTEHDGDSGIVYRMSRKKVEDTASWLDARGVKSLPYHAGLGKIERDANQDRFMREDGLVMVATVAFGMGVDKPDVRFVAHLDPPKSLEAYHQETGRAGRDGLPANAWMSFGLGDLAVMRRLIAPDEVQAGQKRIELQKLNALAGYCDATSCRRQVLLGYFGEDLAEPCGNCDLCLNPVETVDGTVAAQKALSCVYRTGQRFGVGHLVNVLRGRASKNVLAFNHDQVSTFGIGEEYSSDQWKAIYRQLLADGSLEIESRGYGTLRLTDRAWSILRSERAFPIRLEETRRRGEKRERRKKRVWSHDFLETAEEKELFETLRDLRAELARREGVPPYQVFGDKTLLGMALHKPLEQKELLDISGVGAVKLDRYGEVFMKALLEHYQARGRGEPRFLPEEEEAMRAAEEKAAAEEAADAERRERRKALKKGGKQEKGASVEASLEMFRELGSVEAVAEARALTPGTVLGHLVKAVGGGELDADAVLTISPEDKQRIEKKLAAFQLREITALKPVYDALDGAFDYDVIRCVRAGMWARGKKRKKISRC